MYRFKYEWITFCVVIWFESKLIYFPFTGVYHKIVNSLSQDFYEHFPYAIGYNNSPIIVYT